MAQNMPKLYPQIQPGEWVQPLDTYRFACCDCGLVHQVEFRIHEGRIQFRMWRHDRSTAQLRKHRTYPCFQTSGGVDHG